MKNIPNKNEGDTWSADDENLGATGELKNIVTKTQQTLNENDLFQVTKAAMRLDGGQTSSIFYTDTGVSPTHIINYVGALSGISHSTAYENGFTAQFISAFTTDGVTPTTINVGTLGAIPVLDSDNGLIINAGSLVTAVYINGFFYINQSQSFNLYEQIEFINKINISKKVGDSLVKDVGDDFILTSKYKVETGNDVILYDGYEIQIDMGELVLDFQNKLNPTLTVDNTPTLEIANASYFAVNDGNDDFDRNTLSQGLNFFRYDEANNIWLWSCRVKSNSGNVVWYPHSTQKAGFLGLDGTLSFGTSGDYPNGVLSRFFVGANNTVDLANASVAGKSTTTLQGELNQGQIENITGSFTALPTGILSSPPLNANGEDVFNITEAGSSVIADHIINREFIGGSRGLDLIDFDASNSVNTGTQTLTRRYGSNAFGEL